jgi:protein tyrosine phosphatase (PTP) superfamily phosphohydrolase (DUF442 family)
MRSARARRLLGVCLAVVLGGAAAGGALYGWWALVEHRFAAVTEGQVYRSAAMPPERLVEKVREHGIRAVVDLRSGGPEVEAERAALAAAGVKHFHVPSRQVPLDESIDAFLEVAARAENRPLLVHCEHGVGRAPLYAAIYRLEFEGWSNERARRAAWWGSGLGSFEPEDDKGGYLLRYERRAGPSREASQPSADARDAG